MAYTLLIDKQIPFALTLVLVRRSCQHFDVLIPPRKRGTKQQLGAEFSISMIKLSPKELEAVTLFAKLGRWTLVAERMGVSIGTAKTHKESAMRKLGASTSVELVTLAIRRGLVDVNSRKEDDE